MTALLVVAKAPVPGLAKTRLCPPATPEQAEGILSAPVSFTFRSQTTALPPERIVLLHGSRADDPEAFVSTITLAETAGRTEVTLSAIFKTKEQRDRVVAQYHAIEGAEQTLGRHGGFCICSVLLREGASNPASCPDSHTS